MADVSDLSDTQNQWEFSCDLEVDFESEENASIVYSALAVDKELQPDKVKRLMSISDGKLSVIQGNGCDMVAPMITVGRNLQMASEVLEEETRWLDRHFEAVEARFLRASFSAFVDVLTLATKTIEEFGPGMEL